MQVPGVSKQLTSLATFTLLCVRIELMMMMMMMMMMTPRAQHIRYTSDEHKLIRSWFIEVTQTLQLA